METRGYGTIKLRPHTAQFFINELPMEVLCLVFFGIAGTEGFGECPIILYAGVILLILLIYRLVYLKTTEYTVTAEQLIIEHGVLTRSSDYIELYRVVDFREHRNIMQQMAGLKTVSIYSGDRTSPRLDITGVANSYPLVAAIRERVEYNKRRKGIYEITNR